jgi:hypothetical protein
VLETNRQTVWSRTKYRSRYGQDINRPWRER